MSVQLVDIPPCREQIYRLHTQDNHPKELVFVQSARYKCVCHFYWPDTYPLIDTAKADMEWFKSC